MWGAQQVLHQDGLTLNEGAIDVTVIQQGYTNTSGTAAPMTQGQTNKLSKEVSLISWTPLQGNLYIQLENKWIFRLGTFYGESGLNARNILDSAWRVQY